MKKSAEKTDETVTLEENLAKAAIQLGEANKHFLEVLSASGRGNATDAIVARLADRNADDVVLICDVRLVSRSGEICRIFGENTLPAALSPNMIGHSHEGFDRMLDTVLVKPLVISFQNHLSGLVVTDENSLPRIGNSLGVEGSDFVSDF
jgi:hypothetical protein